MLLPPALDRWPIARTALSWALAWSIPGATCTLGNDGHCPGDVFCADMIDPRFSLAILFPAGLACGAVYGLARRFVYPFGRRAADTPLGLTGRVVAGVYGFVVMALPLFLAGEPTAAGLLGTIGLVTAMLFPGNADVERPAGEPT